MFRLLQIEQLICLAGRYAAGRLDQQELKIAVILQKSQLLSDAFHPRAAVHDAIWHIGPDAFGRFRDLFKRLADRAQRVHGADHRAGIGAAPGQSGLHRDPFFHTDMKMLLQPIALAHERKRPHDEVGLIAGHVRTVAFQDIPAAANDIQRIMQPQRHHDHPQLMIAIRPSADDIKRQIDLRIRFYFHVHTPQTSSGRPTAPAARCARQDRCPPSAAALPRHPFRRRWTQNY